MTRASKAPPLLLAFCWLSSCSGEIGIISETLPADAAARRYVFARDAMPGLPRGRSVYDCGPEALCAVMAFWGRPADVDRTSLALGVAERGGTLAPDLVRRAQEEGFAVTLKSGSLGAVKNAIDRGTPPILVVRPRPGLFHYLVVAGYGDRDDVIVCLHYGARRRIVGYSELEECWAPAGHEMILMTPATAESEFELAAAAERNGRWEEGILHYGAAVRLDPGHVLSRLGLGNCLRALGKRGEARRAYEEALAVAPADPATLNNLADLLLEPGGYPLQAEEMAARAADAFGEEFRRTPRPESEFRLACALGTLGAARFANGKPGPAAEAWKSSLEHLPAEPPDPRARRMLDLARAGRARNQEDEAREWLRKALETARDPALRAAIEAEVK